MISRMEITPWNKIGSKRNSVLTFEGKTRNYELVQEKKLLIALLEKPRNTTK